MLEPLIWCNYCTKIVSVPTIKRFSAYRICIYAADHMPPHFHVLANDGSEALVVIDSLQVLQGDAGRQAMQQAIEWARTNQDALQATWKECNDEQ